MHPFSFIMNSKSHRWLTSRLGSIRKLIIKKELKLSYDIESPRPDRSVGKPPNTARDWYGDSAANWVRMSFELYEDCHWTLSYRLDTHHRARLLADGHWDAIELPEAELGLEIPRSGSHYPTAATKSLESHSLAGELTQLTCMIQADG